MIPPTSDFRPPTWFYLRLPTSDFRLPTSDLALLLPVEDGYHSLREKNITHSEGMYITEKNSAQAELF